MAAVPARPLVSADAFCAVVSAYADRVHDDVRRLGCSPVEAIEVVEASAFRVLEQIKSGVGDDLVGAWFREARALGRRTAGAAGDGGGTARPGAILAGSADDAAARAALDTLADRDRHALLLRDSYDLPYSAAAVALGVDVAQVPVIVGHARLAFADQVAGLLNEELAAATTHGKHIGDLAQLVDGTLPRKREGAVRSHLAGCATCGAVETPMREARRLVSALAIVALPDDERDEFITRAGRAASRDLPTAEQVAAAQAAAAEPRPLVSRALVASALSLAVVLGAMAGVVTSGDGPTQASGPGEEEIEESESPSESPSASPSPSPSVTPTMTMSPTPSASSSFSSTRPSPTASTSTSSRPPWRGLESISINPTSGTNCSTTVTVTGSNWYPGVPVQITYRDLVGRVLQGAARVVPGPSGTFTARIVPCDDSRIPGPHTIRASNGDQTDEAGYTASV